MGNAELVAMTMPCSGKVDIQYLLKSVETGSDAVVLVGCKSSECKFLQGNLRARKRIGAVDEILEEAGFGSHRAVYIQLHGDQTPDEILRELQESTTVIMNEPDSPREA